MHGVTEEQEAEYKAWADAHYPVICDCRHAMILNAVLDDFERWFCKSCQRLKIREIPREGWTEPAWSIGANFADHLRNTERIRPIGPAAVHHKCARCDHPFTAKPDGFVDEALENEIAAHRDRCFVVGDYVRWEYGPSQPRNWVDGKLLSLDVKLCQIDVTAAGEDRPLNFQFGPTGLRLGGAMSLRHIPRPSPRPPWAMRR